MYFPVSAKLVHSVNLSSTKAYLQLKWSAEDAEDVPFDLKPLESPFGSLFDTVMRCNGIMLGKNSGVVNSEWWFASFNWGRVE